MTSLLQLWISQRVFFETKSIEQLISIAGDGVLRDGNETSQQLRELFANLPFGDLKKYTNECLNHSVPQGGLVLQDLVNEIGNRLGFAVESGYYRGSPSKIGFNGIWRAKDNYAFVVEVKTTDTYQLNLDTQARYRQRLIAEGRITEDQSSILLIVGRSDTGGLEAQTRGSRHAWDVRLISIDALLKLLHVKENLSNSATVSQIQEVLKPLEYTRIDRLIDIIFRTSEDLQIDETEELDVIEIGSGQAEVQIQAGPVKYHEGCVARISINLGTPLIKQGRCNYTNADQSVRVLCIVSKEYERSGSIRYWYAFHPSQSEFLSEGRAFVAMGCGSVEQIILMPADEFKKYLPAMRTTESEGRMYWHVEVFKRGNCFLLNKSTADGIDVSRYLVPTSLPR